MRPHNAGMTTMPPRDGGAAPEPARRPTVRRRRRKRPRWLAPGRWSALLGSPWAEWLIVLGLFLVALAIRWPYLLRLPHFTDETVETEWALAIWRDGIRPLTASDRYYGPLHPYIVALCLWLFGPAIVLPRAIVMVFGALTVPLTYRLGRATAGRAVGLLAAALLATAPQHIIVNSHVAWQNSTTPFYAVLTFLALANALRWATEQGAAGAGAVPGRGGRVRRWHPSAALWLPVAGFCYGLTLQTHVGTIVLAPALALTFLLTIGRARAWWAFRTPWPWLAPVAGLLAYSPVLIDNLRNGLAGVHRVQTRRGYAYEMHLTPEKYRQNMGDFWLELARIISNPLRIPTGRWHYLTSPYLLLMAALGALGVVLLLRRGRSLPFWALLCTALIMPAFNRAYGQSWDRYLLTGRYITFLLPLAFIAVATAALALVGFARQRLPDRWLAPRPRSALGALAGAALLLLLLYPLPPLVRYYTREAAQDPANASFLATVDRIQTLREPQTPVVIGRMFAKVDLKDGADAREILDLLFALRAIPHVSPHRTGAEIDRLVREAPPGDPARLPLIVMLRDECWQLPDRRHFQRVSERYVLRELYPQLPSYYAVYRYVPTGQPGDCAPATGPEPGE